jgi:hypothetical protein
MTHEGQKGHTITSEELQQITACTGTRRCIQEPRPVRINPFDHAPRCRDDGRGHVSLVHSRDSSQARVLRGASGRCMVQVLPQEAPGAQPALSMLWGQYPAPGRKRQSNRDCQLLPLRAVRPRLDRREGRVGAHPSRHAAARDTRREAIASRAVLIALTLPTWLRNACGWQPACAPPS